MSSSKTVKKSEPPSIAKLLLVAALSFYFLHSLTLIDATPPPQLTPEMIKTMNPLQMFTPVIEQLIKSFIITGAFFMQFIIPGMCLAGAFWQMGLKTWAWLKNSAKRKL
jgi:hypothetical protein